MDNTTNLLQDSTEISVSIKIVTDNTLNGFNLKDGSFVHKLFKEATLEKIRDTLMRRRDEGPSALHMGSNCFFLDKHHNQILPANESHTKLDEILQTLNKEKILYIRQTTDYDWTQLIIKCEHGFTFDEDNVFIKDASESAFKININKVQTKYKLNNHSEDEEECKHNFEAFCKRNLILGGNVLASSLWLSTSLGLSNETSKQMFCNFEKSNKCSRQRWKKAIIVLQESCISPAEEFIKAVENALAMSTDSKKLEKLREISKKYGQFYARRLVFGGAIIKEKIYTSKSNGSSKIRAANNKIGLSALGVAKVNVNLNITRRIEKKTKAFSSYSTTRTRVVGGITEEYDSQDDSIKSWLSSLKDHTTWDIIEYDEIGLIFDLLDDGLRKQIFDILGYPILKAHIDEIEFNASKLKPVIYPLSTYIEDLEGIKINECQIYASVISEYKDAFSLHVNYVDEETPEIIVHLIQNKAEKQHLIFKLCWIIVGLPVHFNFDPINYPIILKSKKYFKFEEKDHYVIENTGAPRFSESCILCTCVLEPEKITNNDSSSATDDSVTISNSNSATDNSATISGASSVIDKSAAISGSNSVINNYVPAKVIKDTSSIVIGTHIALYKHSACLFAYDIKNRKKVIDKNVLKRISLYACQTGVGISLETCSFGQKEVTWRKSRTHNKISYSKQKNTLFTKDQTSKNLIFVNQIFNNCFENGSENCQYHGSVNVKSNEVIYGSFNSKSLNNVEGKFSYLIVPQILI
ncbi:hypothetical protein F8M41_002395 [Gigaspora margarita]|uniref:MACPF domain-containing protein n=1 Tax=Gigaspora margarita TaxID=4874 RepID=A0A8H3XCY1_GIGMA|nr:hypothetical protein F8M41_002395 [Gigaspora margarita]